MIDANTYLFSGYSPNRHYHRRDFNRYLAAELLVDIALTIALT